MATVDVYNQAGDIQKVDESKLALAAKDGYVPPTNVSNDKGENHLVHPNNLSKALESGFKPKESNSPEMYENFNPLNALKDIDPALKGYTSGVTLGGQGVLGGVVQAGIDSAVSAGHNILPNLIDPSPTQRNAMLKEKGATGNFGPTNEKDLYYQGKHETNADFDKAREKNPYTFGATELAGGLALPLGSIAKGAQAIKGASPLAKIIAATKAGAKTGAMVGGAGGFIGGRSDLGGDESNPLGVVKDVAIGTGLGTVIGGGLGGAVSGISEGAKALTGGWKNIASNRAAAAMGIDAEKNMAPVTRQQDAIKRGFEPGRADAKSVGQTLLENEALPKNPFSFKQTIKDKLQSIINKKESELHPILEEIHQNTTGNAAQQELSFLEKAKGYKKFLDMKKQLEKHPEYGTTAAEDAQAAIPTARGETLPKSTVQTLNEKVPPTPDFEGNAGGMDRDTINQLREQLNPIVKQHANVTGENPGVALFEQLNPPPPNPMQLGSGEATTLLPKPNVSAPELPLGMLEKQAMLDKFNAIQNKASAPFNPDLPHSNKVATKLSNDSGAFTEDVIGSTNNPLRLNQLKRDLYKEAEIINKDAYVPGKELPVAPQAEINLRKAQANALKTQVENLGEQYQPGMGKQIADINAAQGNLIAASKGIDKVKPLGFGLDTVFSPVRTLTNAALGRPANIATAKIANAMPGMVNDVSQFAAKTSLPGAIADKVVEKNIYNRNNEAYKQYAKKLSANPQYAHIGNKLQQALQNNDSMAKSQALFLIQQTPGARKAIDENGGQ